MTEFSDKSVDQNLPATKSQGVIGEIEHALKLYQEVGIKGYLSEEVEKGVVLSEPRKGGYGVWRVETLVAALHALSRAKEQQIAVPEALLNPIQDAINAYALDVGSYIDDKSHASADTEILTDMIERRRAEIKAAKLAIPGLLTKGRRALGGYIKKLF